MRKSRHPLLAALACLLVAGAGPIGAELRPGRALDPGKTFSVRLSAGQIDGINGEVRETKRAGASGVTTEGRFLETYSFEELGFGESYGTFGIELEKNWRYVTLQADVQYASIDTSATARRVYALGVEDVEYRGSTYEYMLIPGGQRFDAELDALIVDAKARITPFHLASRNGGVTLNPWFLVSIYAMGADYTIDAGPARGLTTYEIDPFQYVIGGTGNGTAGAFLPGIGAGAELRFQLMPVKGDHVELALQGDFAFLDVVANTGDFGVSARNEKNLDTQYEYYEARAQLEVPLSTQTDLLFGLGLRHVKAEAEIEANRQAPGQSTTEKYDKYATAELNSFFGFIGLKF
jgi:opacity protein-like surface antigen